MLLFVRAYSLLSRSLVIRNVTLHRMFSGPLITCIDVARKLILCVCVLSCHLCNTVRHVFRNMHHYCRVTKLSEPDNRFTCRGK
jgi:succinate dehydrogenase/fumarate reductase cytochrome b subunit